MPRSVSSLTLEALSAQETDVVFHTLIRVRPSGLLPQCFTDNSEPIIFRGDTYNPAAMKVGLPDSVEGRASHAELSIENIDNRLISILRSIVIPPRVDIYIVSSVETVFPIEEFTDLQFAGHATDGPYITIKLTLDNLEREQFPEWTFDKRFEGLWP